MPIQSPPWTDYMVCPVCTKEFAANQRAPITLGCGHSICKNCLTTVPRKQCPYDQTDISKNFENLPINYALLQLTTSNIESLRSIDRELAPSVLKTLTAEDLKYYQSATKCIEELALLLKPSGNISGLLSRPMQRKLVTLVQCQLLETEGRARSLRAVRSLGERTVTELILQHQNPHQLSANLWAAVRSRGCQFLGPAMQEEVLKLVLLALEDGSPLSRKILVMYVVQKLEATFPQASKTSIGHVVQLLYRASCFKVSKREGDSSLMTLKEEFRTYDALRREHDTQIVQIATEAGLRIAPDQWSSLLYGDNNHKSHMQSIIDKQQSPSSFAQSVDELILALQRTGDPAKLANLRNDLENLSKIDPSVELTANTSWSECAEAMCNVREVVFGLVNFVQHHGKNKIQDSYNQHTSRYKVSFCRELQARGTCARGQNCSFAHSEEELERYRAKYKKNSMRTILQNNQLKENNIPSNGPIPKVNTSTNNHPNFLKGPPPPPTPPANRHNLKQIPYRSENSLHHPPATTHPQIPHNNSNHHLRPSHVYATSNGGSSSSSTPNLTQMQLSPNPAIPKSSSPQINSRFSFGNTNGQHTGKIDLSHYMTANCSIPPIPFNHQQQQRPPLSAPPVAANYLSTHNKKPNSPYHSAMNSYNNHPIARVPHQMNNYPSQSQIPPTSPMNNNNYRNGMMDKYVPYYQQPPPPNSPNMHGPMAKSQSAPPSALGSLMHETANTDDVDGSWINNAGAPQLTDMLPPGVSAYLFGNKLPVAKNRETFIRSDSILENSKLDETFENLTVSGKYGAIGGLNKSPDTSQHHHQQQQQWSTLRDSLVNQQYDIAGSRVGTNNNNNNNLGGNVFNKNGNHTVPPPPPPSSSLLAHPYSGGINNNFLNINSSMTSNPSTKTLTSNDDYWSIKDSSSSSTKTDLDIGALGNGMSVLNLLDLINE